MKLVRKHRFSSNNTVLSVHFYRLSTFRQDCDHGLPLQWFRTEPQLIRKRMVAWISKNLWIWASAVKDISKIVIVSMFILTWISALISYSSKSSSSLSFQLARDFQEKQLTGDLLYKWGWLTTYSKIQGCSRSDVLFIWPKNQSCRHVFRCALQLGYATTKFDSMYFEPWISWTLIQH